MLQHCREIIAEQKVTLEVFALTQDTEITL
jgi:hypothetical protein